MKEVNTVGNNEDLVNEEEGLEESSQLESESEGNDLSGEEEHDEEEVKPLPQKPKRNSRNKRLQRQLVEAQVKNEQLEHRLTQVEKSLTSNQKSPQESTSVPVQNVSAQAPQQTYNPMHSQYAANLRNFDEELKECSSESPEVEKEIRDILSNPGSRNPLSKLDASVGHEFIRQGVSPYDVYGLSKKYQKEIRQLVMNGVAPSAQVNAVNLMLDELRGSQRKESAENLNERQEQEEPLTPTNREYRKAPKPTGYIRGSVNTKSSVVSSTNKANQMINKAKKSTR